jgi:hypothetical protein
MRNSGTQNICPNCRRPMTLEPQPGGKSPRTFQCLDCDRPDDPINSPAVMGMIDASAASEAVSVIEPSRKWTEDEDLLVPAMKRQESGPSQLPKSLNVPKFR